MTSRLLVFGVVVAVAVGACGEGSEPLDVDVGEPERIEATTTPRSAPTVAVTPSAKPGVAGMPGPPASALRARVARIVDGDTVVLDGISVGEVDSSTGGRRARLIGIDTPEVHGGSECYGSQASAFTKAELDGRDVLVDFDVERTDRYGRALVYLWTTDGRFFNGRLAAEGYAQQATFPPNVRYAELFTRLVREAREGNRGLWAGCSAEPTPAPTARSSGDCHPSYPDFCIAPPPPDLNCPDVDRKRFTVRHDVADPDPHGFDRDRDGVGCES